MRDHRNLTPAAARALAGASKRYRTFGVERRLREQLLEAGLVTVETYGRETALRLTPAGRDARAEYRRAGAHRVARQPLERSADVDAAVAGMNAAAAGASVVATIAADCSADGVLIMWNLDSYRHPVVECGYLEPDVMIEHNRRVGFDVAHAGHSYYAGRGRWENLFGERIDQPDPNDTETWLARRAADRKRIPPFLESPRPEVPSWW